MNTLALIVGWAVLISGGLAMAVLLVFKAIEQFLQRVGAVWHFAIFVAQRRGQWTAAHEQWAKSLTAAPQPTEPADE